MTTDLDETRLQLFFLPLHVYVEDTITVDCLFELTRPDLNHRLLFLL
jgi:hypothetical protein